MNKLLPGNLGRYFDGALCVPGHQHVVHAHKVVFALAARLNIEIERA